MDELLNDIDSLLEHEAEYQKVHAGVNWPRIKGGQDCSTAGDNRLPLPKVERSPHDTEAIQDERGSEEGDEEAHLLYLGIPEQNTQTDKGATTTPAIVPSPQKQQQQQQQQNKKNTAEVPKSNAQEPSGLDDIDSILESILQDTHDGRGPSAAASEPKVNSGVSNAQIRQANSRRRCHVIFLGSAGSNANGERPHSAQSICDNLRCTYCDLRVIQYPGRKWDSSVDYLYFRNNYPDTVEQRLIVDSDHTSYCCQCSWISVCGTVEMETLRAAERLHWICGGHTTS